MSEQELFTEINLVIQKYQPHEIYFPLKSYGVRHIRTTTSKVAIACVIVDYMQVPITVNLISGITGIAKASIGQMLARLGDKNVLNLKGYTKAMLTYEVHHKFKTHLKLDYTEIDTFVSRWNEKHG